VTACVTLVAFLTLLDTAIVATAVPRITDTFHSLKDVGWYAGAYQLGSAVLQPPSGRLYTLFNTKWTFLAFFGLFELGSLLCGVATSSTMMIVGRAVSGLGAAGIMNGALTIIASVVPLHKRAQLTGIMMGCCQMGIVCGPLLGGAFTEYVTWRWCFYINLPVGGAVAVFLCLIHIPEQMKKPQPRTVFPQLHRRLDPVGFALLSAATVQLLLALQFGGSQFPWDSSTVIGLFCGSGATYIVWAGWNYRMGDAAMIPVSMAKKRAIWSAALTQMLFFTNTFVQSFFLPIYFQAVKGASPLMAGVYMLPNIGMQIVAAVSSGFLVGKLGYYLPWALASAIVASIGVGFFSTFSPATSTGVWIGLQLVSGFGRGMGMQMPILAVQATVKSSEISLGMSFLSFTQFLGMAIFLVAGNTIFNEKLKTGLIHYAPNVNPAAVIAAGATGYRHFVSPQDIPGVVMAYAKSVDAVFYLAAAAVASSFFTAWGMGWVDIRKKKTPVKTDV
jgi:hypothetical protein